MAHDEMFGDRDVAERVAAAWERYRDRLFENQRAVSEWLVDRVAPKPGQTILELTAGPGETGFLVAERLLPAGRLISTDLAEGMVGAARRGADARGLTNVECRTMDAQAIDLPDASVDGVLSRFGLMLVPEPAKAFAESRRALRSGGHLAYAVFGTPDRNPWLTLLVMAIVTHGHTLGGDPFGPGGPFSLADPDTNRTMLETAGFDSIDVEELPGTMHYHSVDDYWEMQSAVGGPIAMLVDTMSDDEQANIKATLATLAEPYERDGAYDMPSVVIAVSAC
jgi:ubiquinone/menaquinone biosynthesis C-methylase UbiE